ncbi:hypothetical protein RX327_31770 [Bradyrhizobium sp. BEA-2-5]|uniref:hypothetical protein n=1 Tax=Bradyrhizobium sp. BEA-2-5 TaxID=3080015 RepID=UPI00293E8499|nr:hypothetical protein [Bradyrhizobium sp. BEA-2-5]WOH80350.1 hypothetical protein RX327_31770 [Bradyrhizobium sp. BEA-2-5]
MTRPLKNMLADAVRSTLTEVSKADLPEGVSPSSLLAEVAAEFMVAERWLTRTDQAGHFEKLGHDIAGDLVEPRHYDDPNSN